MTSSQSVKILTRAWLALKKARGASDNLPENSRRHFLTATASAQVELENAIRCFRGGPDVSDNSLPIAGKEE